MTEMLSLTVLLLLIMDPLGNLPIFMSSLKSLETKRRTQILIREMCIALAIMLFFLFAGEKMLRFLTLSTEAVSVSGGIILFFIGIRMIFPAVEAASESTGLQKAPTEPFLVPLAVPLVAGPSLLATLMLLSHRYAHQMLKLVLSLLLAWIASLIILLFSGAFSRLLGEKGLQALERVMGLILVMLATQMLLDGIRVYLKL